MAANSLVFDSAWSWPLLTNGTRGSYSKISSVGWHIFSSSAQMHLPLEHGDSSYYSGFTFNILCDLLVWSLPPGLKFLILLLSWLCLIGSEVFLSYNIRCVLLWIFSLEVKYIRDPQQNTDKDTFFVLLHSTFLGNVITLTTKIRGDCLGAL